MVEEVDSTGGTSAGSCHPHLHLVFQDMMLVAMPLGWCFEDALTLTPLPPSLPPQRVSRMPDGEYSLLEGVIK
jgi:hypothetical protein